MFRRVARLACSCDTSQPATAKTAVTMSAIAATAAAHLSPLVDWADLDGPLLTARDPFAGVEYVRGKLLLPDAPGLGVRERALA